MEHFNFDFIMIFHWQFSMVLHARQVWRPKRPVCACNVISGVAREQQKSDRNSFFEHTPYLETGLVRVSTPMNNKVGKNSCHHFFFRFILSSSLCDKMVIHRMQRIDISTFYMRIYEPVANSLISYVFFSFCLFLCVCVSIHAAHYRLALHCPHTAHFATVNGNVCGIAIKINLV